MIPSCTLVESINLNTPAVPVDSGLGDRYLMEQEKQVMTDINDAIAVATANLGLIPGAAYQARVSQLAELNTAHKTVSATFSSPKNLSLIFDSAI